MIFEDSKYYPQEVFTEMSDLNLQAYNEVYFGDKPIAEIQKHFDSFRKKFFGKRYDVKMNYDKDLLEFNRLIEKQFGFYNFALKIDPSMGCNAYTLNVSYGSDIDIKNIGDKLRIEKNGNGFRYAEGTGISCVAAIYMGLLSDPTFTNREIVAILLHEIGHNFTYSVLNYDGSFIGKAASMFMKTMSKLIRKNLTDERDFSDEKVSKDIEEKSGIFSAVKNAFGKIKKVNFKDMVSSVAANMKGNSKYTRYTDEKFADTFASMYGYGADINSALQKMHQQVYDRYLPKETPSDLSIFFKLFKWNTQDILAIALNIKDEHPEGLTRIAVQIQYLEKELAKESLDPKVKMELQQQLAAQKKLIEDFINYQGDPDGAKAIRAYYTKLYEKYGGERREMKTDNKALFDLIDDTYNKLSK